MIKLNKKHWHIYNGSYKTLNLPSLRVGENMSLTAFLHQETTCINPKKHDNKTKIK